MQNGEITFSVVIPVYNGEKHVTRALDSVKNQTCDDYEVIVTDDGSNDKTSDILSGYNNGARQMAIQIHRQDNRGIGSARNRGLFNARGKYIAFLDADDAWYPAKLEKIAACLKSNPDVEVFYHDEMEIKIDGAKKIAASRQLAPPAYEDLLFAGNRLSTSATVVNRDFAVKIGGFSENLNYNSSEDYELWLRLAGTGARFLHVPEVLSEYYRTESSITLKNIEYHHAAQNMVIEKHFAELMKSGKYSNAYLEKLRTTRLSATNYSKGRMYYYINDFENARKCYLKTMKTNPFWLKPYIAYLQTFFNVFYTRRHK